MSTASRKKRRQIGTFNRRELGYARVGKTLRAATYAGEAAGHRVYTDPTMPRGRIDFVQNGRVVGCIIHELPIKHDSA